MADARIVSAAEYLSGLSAVATKPRRIGSSTTAVISQKLQRELDFFHGNDTFDHFLYTLNEMERSLFSISKQLLDLQGFVPVSGDDIVVQAVQEDKDFLMRKVQEAKDHYDRKRADSSVQQNLEKWFVYLKPIITHLQPDTNTPLRTHSINRYLTVIDLMRLFLRMMAYEVNLACAPKNEMAADHWQVLPNEIAFESDNSKQRIELGMKLSNVLREFAKEYEKLQSVLEKRIKDFPKEIAEAKEQATSSSLDQPVARMKII